MTKNLSTVKPFVELPDYSLFWLISEHGAKVLFAKTWSTWSLKKINPFEVLSHHWNWINCEGDPKSKSVVLDSFGWETLRASLRIDR